MSSQTSRFKVPYPTSGDAVASVDDIVKSMADHLDLILGEVGEVTVNHTSGSTVSQRVNYTRDYSAAIALGLTPKVVGLVPRAGTGASMTNWGNQWANGEDATGFTINVHVNTTGSRTLRYQVRMVTP